MKLYWHIKNNHPHLILIFNGWGFDQRILRTFTAHPADILLVYDYSILAKENLPSFADYRQVDLLAWSFGVFAATEYASVLPQLKHCIAVNGTLTPVHDKYGIPPTIFYATLQNYNEEKQQRFARRIAGNLSAYHAMQDQLPQRSPQDQLNELIALEKRFHIPQTHKLNWTQAILSENDKIFPFDNMYSAWKMLDSINIKTVKENHYIDFNLLIKDLLPC